MHRFDRALLVREHESCAGEILLRPLLRVLDEPAEPLVIEIVRHSRIVTHQDPSD
jgi:hypothetical protein